MKHLFLFVFAAIILTSACQKDEPNDEPETKQESYLPLKVGNYWVYEKFKIESSGEATSMGISDSLYVKDSTITLINGEKYFEIMGWFPAEGNEPVYLKVADNYCINSDGEKLFSTSNLSDTLAEVYHTSGSDTNYYSYSKMEEVAEKITVPAGTYDVIEYRTTLITFNEDEQDEFNFPKYGHSYYAEGVGLVLKSWCYAHSPETYEHRLVRYHVQE